MGKQEAKAKYTNFIPPHKKVENWYKNFNFVLIDSMEKLEGVFKDVKPKSYYMGFDTETTGLDFEELDLVGYSFCLDGKNTYYVPVYHFDYEHNLGEASVDFIYQKMVEAKKVFMFNSRYDMRVMEYIGYKDKKEELDKKRWKFVKYDMSKVDYFDVACAVWNSDTNIKMPSLKYASEHFLGFSQMHFDEVVENAGNFFYLNPSTNPDVAYYAGADALCTYLLVTATAKYFIEAKMAGKLDNAVLYPLMHFENEKLWLDKDKLDRMEIDARKEVDRLEKEVYDMIGYQINLNSPRQVAQAFSRLGIDTGERTASGTMATGMSVLNNLPEEVLNEYPALKSFVEYKKMYKLLSSYISVYQKEANSRGFLRGSYKNTDAPTGRLACGKDGKNHFFSPVNLQAIPKPHVSMYDVFDLGDRKLFRKKDNILFGYQFKMSQYDKDGNHIVPEDSSYIGMAEGMNPKFNLRDTILPKMYEDSGEDEFCYCTCDYAAQELRITANISREPIWTDAFLHGKDVHKSTAIALWGEQNYNKDYRKRAKGFNFGIIYGMGPSSMVGKKFGIHSLPEAEQFYAKFQNTLPTLFQWIDRTQRRARKMGTTYTFFGRPRRLKSYYQNGNIGFANRTSVNTVIQGTAGDMLKLVMCRLWKNLYNNPEYENDISFMVTIHDEIGNRIRTSRANELVGLIEQNQTVKIKEWPIPIITEASLGWSMGNVFAFERVWHTDENGNRTGEWHYEPKLD